MDLNWHNWPYYDMSDPLPRSLGVLIPPGFSSRGRRVLGVSPLPGYNLHLFPLSPPVSPSLKIFLSLPVSRTCVKRESPGKISPYLKDIIRKLSYFEQLIQPTNFLLLYTGLTDCAALALHCTITRYNVHTGTDWPGCYCAIFVLQSHISFFLLHPESIYSYDVEYLYKSFCRSLKLSQ